MQSEDIRHQGIIESIDGNVINVSIINASACAACHAKGSCVLSESKKKTIEIEDQSGQFSQGETVDVSMARSSGYRALLLGYLVPFLILFIALIIVSQLTRSEFLAGLIAIFALIPYFATLYFYRKRLNQAFSFKLNKI